MKFTVEREHLLKPLQQVSGPLGGRPTLPILGNLLLQVADGALSLTGTDLEMEMVARVALIQPHEPGATTKSGVMGVTRLMANEWAKHNINVNAIAPGYMATNNTQQLRADEQRS
ncbi:SDR family NAD(P)-dependent oxidoreductase, partial [Citrobacter amalonaticus]|uniref:SDR family NAD(P)-dependent oxidoreductase n=1 Tax=Citrobacter amalonaticus TaxID=35703 RepID=UPI000AD45674